MAWTCTKDPVFFDDEEDQRTGIFKAECSSGDSAANSLF